MKEITIISAEISLKDIQESMEAVRKVQRYTKENIKEAEILKAVDITIMRAIESIRGVAEQITEDENIDLNKLEKTLNILFFLQ